MTGYNNCHPDAERERCNAQSRLYAAQPMTAASEFFFQVIHSSDDGPGKGAKKGNASKKSRPKKIRKAKKADPQTKMKHFFQTKVNEDGYPMKMCEYEPTERKHVYRPPGYGGQNRHNRWYHDGSHCTLCHLKPCIAYEYYQETSEFFFDLNISKEQSASVCVADTTEMLQKLYCKIMKRRYLKREIPPSCIRDRVNDLKNYTDGDSLNEDSDAESHLSIDLSAIDEFCSKDPMAYGELSTKPIPLHIFYKNKRFKDAKQNGSTDKNLDSSKNDSEIDSEDDSDDDDFPLSVLRDHQIGDLSVEEKIAHYRTKKAQQKAVDLKNTKPAV